MLVEVIRVLLCYYRRMQLTSSWTTAATEKHQACGQIEIMSKIDRDPVLDIRPPLCFHAHAIPETVTT